VLEYSRTISATLDFEGDVWLDGYPLQENYLSEALESARTVAMVTIEAAVVGSCPSSDAEQDCPYITPTLEAANEYVMALYSEGSMQDVLSAALASGEHVAVQKLALIGHYPDADAKLSFYAETSIVDAPPSSSSLGSLSGTLTNGQSGTLGPATLTLPLNLGETDEGTGEASTRMVSLRQSKLSYDQTDDSSWFGTLTAFVPATDLAAVSVELLRPYLQTELAAYAIDEAALEADMTNEMLEYDAVDADGDASPDSVGMALKVSSEIYLRQ
jgi:hypothetical protein